MIFYFPEHPTAAVTRYRYPHDFYGLIARCDAIETSGPFGRIIQLCDSGSRGLIAQHHFKFDTTVNAHLDFEEPTVFLNFVLNGRTDAWHEQLGEMWQRPLTCSLCYLPAGTHIFRIKKGNCISVKSRVSPDLIESLSKEHPEIREFYESITAMSPNGWRLPYVPTGKKTRKLLDKIIALPQTGPTREVLINNMSDELLIDYLADLVKTGNGKKDHYRYDDKEIANMLANRDEILHRKYWGIPFPQLALIFNMPYRRFLKYFKKTFDETIVVAQTKVRMRTACNLLRDTDMPVNAISSYVKYTNHSAFTRTFMKYIGCSPSDYREYYRENKKA